MDDGRTEKRRTGEETEACAVNGRASRRVEGERRPFPRLRGSGRRRAVRPAFSKARSMDKGFCPAFIDVTKKIQKD